jgi:asparagine synthetase B (glutamine-hydrolysing)
MCGIGGIAWTDGDPDTLRGSMVALEAAMDNRGPDESGSDFSTAEPSEPIPGRCMPSRAGRGAHAG